MGKALKLQIPEEDATEELVKEYAQRLAAAQNEHMDEERSYDELVEYKRAIEDLRNGAEVIFYETVMSAPIRGMSQERFNEVFKLEHGDFQRPVLDADQIDELLDAFEDAIQGLNETEPETNWEATLARHITMCEFALDHGYKIELSY